MRKNRKVLSVLLMLVFVMSMILSACSGSNNQSENQSKTGDAAAGDNAKEKTEKPYELQMNIIRYGTDMSRLPEIQKKINEISLKEINATVNITTVDISAWNQQTNLWLAGNEKLDLLVTASHLQYSNQVAKNQLLPLDDLLKKYGKGAMDAVGADTLNATRVDGKIYGVPSVRDFAATYGVTLRKDLIEKHQIDVSKVKTWADLGPVFKILSEKEKMGLSQQSQAGPIAARMIGDQFDVLSDSLGVLSMKDNNLKVVNMFEHPDYVADLKLIREWYEAGYIVKDLATNQQTGQNLTKAGKSFGFTSNMKPGADVQYSAQTGFPMIVLDLTKPIQTTHNIQVFMMSIVKNSKNPEKAMQFLNLLYSNKDIINLLTLGIKGEDYIVNSDGTFSLNKGTTPPYEFNQWEVANNYLGLVQKGNPLDYWDQMKKFNQSAVKSPAFGFTFNAEPVKTEIAAANNALNQFKLGLETGTLDPVKNLPDLNEKLKAAGLGIIIAEKQKQLDAWAASKK